MEMQRSGVNTLRFTMNPSHHVSNNMLHDIFYHAGAAGACANLQRGRVAEAGVGSSRKRDAAGRFEVAQGRGQGARAHAFGMYALRMTPSFAHLRARTSIQARAQRDWKQLQQESGKGKRQDLQKHRLYSSQLKKYYT
eukprot:6203438-Pleurochrysis_carterae.AAC.1